VDGASGDRKDLLQLLNQGLADRTYLGEHSFTDPGPFLDHIWYWYKNIGTVFPHTAELAQFLLHIFSMLQVSNVKLKNWFWICL